MLPSEVSRLCTDARIRPILVVHRLQFAGAALPLFDPTAEEALFQATSGLPMKINLLAHRRPDRADTTRHTAQSETRVSRHHDRA